MSPQDCNNCYYPAPNRSKKEEIPAEVPAVPEGLNGEEDCPQCFYQGEPEVPDVQEEEDCPQCFYQPGGVKQEEKDEAEDCAQCFYQPGTSGKDA